MLCMTHLALLQCRCMKLSFSTLLENNAYDPNNRVYFVFQL